MFESLSEKLENIFKKLKGHGILNEENVNASLKEIRMALLEADVNFKVAKDFIEDVRMRAIGKEVLDSITPGQQIVKIVHDRLVDLMGGVSANIKFGARIPSVSCLSVCRDAEKQQLPQSWPFYYLKEQKKVYLVSADVYRPAAMEQLAVLGKQINAGVFEANGLKRPCGNLCSGRGTAKRNGYEVLIIDTAGRLHIDDLLMEELKNIKEKVNPAEIIYVADAMTGQDAVNVGS
jgi:signal recognition particle subunit SRP54